MAKLKVFRTSIGFFELAVAVPSKKAAMEAFGLNQTAFNHGFVQPTADKKIVAATLSKPGTVLKRAVGTSVDFGEQSALPKLKASKRILPTIAKKSVAPQKPSHPQTPLDRKSLKLQAAEEKSAARKATQQKADAEKAAKHRQKAQQLYVRAEAKHEAREAQLSQEIRTLEARLKSENSRWDNEKRRLLEKY